MHTYTLVEISQASYYTHHKHACHVQYIQHNMYVCMDAIHRGSNVREMQGL